MRIVIRVLVLVLVLAGAAAAAEGPGTKAQAGAAATTPAKAPGLPTSVITQGEFARKLVAQFGWEGGLPRVPKEAVDKKEKKSKKSKEAVEYEEPKDRDFLRIMEGKRTLKFEAENIYNKKTDDVAVRNFDLIGPFSGISWLGGITTPSTVHFKVFIPLAGEYRLSAAAKGNGQLWKIADKEYRVDSGDRLALTPVATLPLKAGELEFEMVMPPEGGVDYLLFSAPDLTPIEPKEGWRFSAPLTNADLAFIVARLLGWEERLPVDEQLGKTTILATELAALPATVAPTDIPYYGQFTGKQWLRAGSQGGTVEIPFTTPRTGIYGLKLRYMGARLAARLDDMNLDRDAKGTLAWIDLGLQRLAEGRHLLQVDLPPYGGLDALVIEPRQASDAAYMALAGIKGDPGAAITVAEADKFITQLVERYTGRK
ncbi:MAG: hypothetical protein HZC44_12095 [Geobacter sp.]|nr:hypothetical protein [Geobacter sp.]